MRAGLGHPGLEPRRQLELLAHFTITPPDGTAASTPPAGIPFTLGATVDLAQGNRVEVSLNGTARLDGAGGLRVADVEMLVDTTHAGGATQAAKWGGPVPLPRDGLPASRLQVRVFVDRSVIEVFGLGGRQRTTVRVYPLDPSTSWGLSLSARAQGATVAAAASVWEVGSCWVDGFV